jgi:hypothetical protein
VSHSFLIRADIRGSKRLMLKCSSSASSVAVLRGEKGKMSANDVAKARDATGVFGMAGV